MINYCENFAMNPDYFKKFTGNEKKDIIQGFRDSLLPYVKIKRTINFFKNQKRYSKIPFTPDI